MDLDTLQWRQMADLPPEFLDGRTVVVKGSDHRPATVHWRSDQNENGAAIGWFTCDGPFPGPILAWLAQPPTATQANAGHCG
jgi:hypothetical protein